MASQTKLYLPGLPSESAMSRSKKDCLKKDIIMLLQEKGLGWTYFNLSTCGENFVSTMTNVLWYLDGHYKALDDRSCLIPDEFKAFEGIIGLN